MSSKLTVLYTCSGEQFVRYLLMATTIVFSILEILFFPSLKNMAGCLMSLVVCIVHCHYCIKERLWLLNPFPTAVMTSVFIYRWLPLIATFIECKPISYHLEMPYITYLVETMMYLLAVCAYLYVIRTSSKMSFLQKLNLKIGLYDSYHPKTLWALGFIGLFAFMSKMYSGSSELGDVGGKFLNGLKYLQYVPLIFIFPDLCNISQSKSNRIWAVIWALMLFVLGIAINSRKGMIMAFFTIFVFAFLHNLLKNKKISHIVTIPRMIVVVLALVISMSFFQSMSKALLATRSIRKEVKGGDLLSATMNAYTQAEDSPIDVAKSTRRYQEGWSEGYIDNHFLNRYCNIRISDESLWHAFRLSKSESKEMLDNFYDRIVFLLPSPIISFLNLDFNKGKIRGSRGDFLYSVSFHSPLFASFRVVSHTGDGIATFGLLYFPLQFVVWIIWFKFYDSLSIRIIDCNTNMVSPVYCILGLSMLFNIFNYGNANGILGEFGYIVRGHWQNLFLFVFFAKTIDRMFRGRSYQTMMKI